MLRAAASLTAVIARQDGWPGIGKVEVVVGLRFDAEYDWSAVTELFLQGGALSVRRIQWASRTRVEVAQIFGLASDLPLGIKDVSLPRDGALDFFDCDAWIIFATSFEGVTLPARPVAIYCADLIQRYVPELFGQGQHAAMMQERERETFLGWQLARCVFATTPATVQDVIEYSGVEPGRTLLVPTLIDPLSVAPQPSSTAEAKLLWITNSSPHKNHQTAVASLREYYARGGTLPVLICGPDSHRLDPRVGGAIRGAADLATMPEVLDRLTFLGEVSDSEYLGLIQNAGVIWHNVVVDNGTFVAFDAARAGRIFVSSDYPQMRYLCERYGVDAMFHSHSDPIDTARVLLNAENHFRSGRKPSHDLHSDPDCARIRAYGALLGRLLRTEPSGNSKAAT
jgi:glycosyltransferase involved in cell wall biosynthesis